MRIAAAATLAICLSPVAAAGDDAELARDLANPLARIINVPIQFNYDTNLGPDDEGDQATALFQPVAPFALDEDWVLISRTILPVILLDDDFTGSGLAFGQGDLQQHLYVSPAKLGSDRIIWGVGPVFSLPTATHDALATEKWGIGPTAGVIRHDGRWTLSFLASHIWSFAGDDSKPGISASYLQPSISYTAPSATTFSLGTESVYDWKNDAWSAPLIFAINQLVDIDGQKMLVGGGVRYWIDSPENGPEGLGARLVVRLLFPQS